MRNTSNITKSLFTISFLLNCAQRVNNPPNVPRTPFGPQYGYRDSVYTFSTSSTDPDQDNIAVRFSWGDGDTSVWSSFVASGETLSLSHAYQDTGRYAITAQAKDENEALSIWSAGHLLRVLLLGENNYPDAPKAPIGPSKGKVDSFYTFSTSAFDPDTDSVAIRFSWGDGDTSVWSSYVPGGQSVSDSHSWRAEGTYLLRAQAKDIRGALSSWSGFSTIKIVTNYPPNIPETPVGPASGWVDSSYNFSSTTTDPEGDSIAMRFSWGDGDTSNWSPYIHSGDTCTMSHSWHTPGTYLIKAQAKDIKGAPSGWSDDHQIVISSTTNNPPDKPSPPAGPDFGYVDSIYFFTSSATDPDGDSVALRFSWGDGDTTNWSSYLPSGGTVEMSHSWSLFGTYLIRAQAKDKSGAESEWSDSLEILIH